MLTHYGSLIANRTVPQGLVRIAAAAEATWSQDATQTQLGT